MRVAAVVVVLVVGSEVALGVVLVVVPAVVDLPYLFGACDVFGAQ